MYNGSYNVWIKKLDNKIIDEITENDIQNIINEMITKGKKPKTIAIVKAISVHYYWKLAMESIGVRNMVMHDLRSMVAVVALRNGADIYAVSKMLSHKLLSTTQANYLNDGTEQAIEAQDTFSSVVGISDEVIDVDVIKEDEFHQLKKIYPSANDEKIKHIIEFMKKEKKE